MRKDLIPIIPFLYNTQIDTYTYLSAKSMEEKQKNSLTNNYQLKLDQMISSRLLSIFRMSWDEKQQQQQSPRPFQQHAKKRTNPSLRETVARKIIRRQRDRSGPLVSLLLRHVRESEREKKNAARLLACSRTSSSCMEECRIQIL
jgi:hypothetical protein